MQGTDSTAKHFPLTELKLKKKKRKKLCLLISTYLLIHCGAAKEIIALLVTADSVYCASVMTTLLRSQQTCAGGKTNDNISHQVSLEASRCVSCSKNWKQWVTGAAVFFGMRASCSCLLRISSQSTAAHVSCIIIHTSHTGNWEPGSRLSPHLLHRRGLGDNHEAALIVNRER